MEKDRRTPRERREQRKKLFLRSCNRPELKALRTFKEMVGTVLENSLEAELEEELSYSKYDYRNKQTDNSRNGYTEKNPQNQPGRYGVHHPPRPEKRV